MKAGGIANGRRVARPSFWLWLWAHLCCYPVGASLNWVVWLCNGGRIIGEFPNGPFVLVANHGSYLDWMLLDTVCGRGRHGRSITFMAKAALIRNAFFRGLMVRCRAIVVREGSRSRSIVQAVNALTVGGGGPAPILGIFPEGTRSRTGERLPASEGAAWLARRCGVPIVPVALRGFWNVWPPHSRLPSLRRGGLTIHILEPLEAADFSDDRQWIDTAMDLIYAVVCSERRHGVCAAGTSGDANGPVGAPVESA